MAVPVINVADEISNKVMTFNGLGRLEAPEMRYWQKQ
jgi:hypothetical protein